MGQKSGAKLFLRLVTPRLFKTQSENGIITNDFKSIGITAWTHQPRPSGDDVLACSSALALASASILASSSAFARASASILVFSLNLK